MNHKSFPISNNIEVLIFRDINDSSCPIVKIYAYWMDKDGDPRLDEEIIIFDYVGSAQAFIKDFSKDSALV